MDRPLSFLRSRSAALVERVRSSLFVVPMLFVLAGVVLAEVLLAIDRRTGDDGLGLPFTGATVDNARAVLTTVAGATIGFAGVAFSISLLVVQMAAGQYTPRVVSGLLRDPFTKRVMGTVVGTFGYCLIVLRAVRSGQNGNESVTADLATAVAVVLGLVAILATIAFINHAAHSMDVSELLQKVTDDAVAVVRSEWPDPDDGGTGPGDEPGDPTDHARVVRFEHSGWVQRIDHEHLLDALPHGTSVQLEIATGRYAVLGAPVGAYWPVPDDGEADHAADHGANGAHDAVEQALRAAVQLGKARTSPQDVGYGIRQLVDVALRALSTGVNDPTTAQDAVFHLCTVLHELLERRPPDVVIEGSDGRRIVRGHAYHHRELVELAFDQLRRAAASEPTVCLYLLEAIHLLCESLSRSASEGRRALLDQAELVVAGCEHADNLPADVDAIRAAYDRRFADAR